MIPSAGESNGQENRNRNRNCGYIGIYKVDIKKACVLLSALNLEKYEYLVQEGNAGILVSTVSRE